MAEFRRSFLKKFDLEADQIDEIIEKHASVVSELKAKAELTEDEKKELKELRKTASDYESLEAKYEALKEQKSDVEKEFNSYKESIKNEKSKNAKATAFKTMLEEIGIAPKVINKILKLEDVSKLEFDDDGNLKDAEKIKQNVKESWADFIVKEKLQGADIPPARNNVGGKTLTKEEILNIKDTGERRKAIAEHPDLFTVK